MKNSPGKGVTWLAFIVGIAASVAGNIAHARPQIGPQIAAAFYPLALLLTVEIMQRVPWPRSGWWSAARFGGLIVVAGVAGVVSYGHMYGLLLSYGEDRLTATIGPLAVDGLVVVSSCGLLALSRTRVDQAGPALDWMVDRTRPDPARDQRTDQWTTLDHPVDQPATTAAPAAHHDDLRVESGRADMDPVDQLMVQLPDLDREVVQAAVRIHARGDQVSRRTLKAEGVKGGTAEITERAKRLREALGDARLHVA